MLRRVVVMVVVQSAVGVERAAFDVRLGERDEIWPGNVGWDLRRPASDALQHPNPVVVAETVIGNCGVRRSRRRARSV